MAKPRSLAAQGTRRTPRHLHQGADTGPRPSPANASQALVDQDAVVAVQRHDVGHGAQRHQVQPVGQIGLGDSRDSRSGPIARNRRRTAPIT